MRHNKVFPKECEEKEKETKQELRIRLRRAEKKIKQLENEIENLRKPVRVRKKHIEAPSSQDTEAWRLEFVKKFKEGLKSDE